MFSSYNLLLIILAITACVIAFQDFKTRLVSLWVLVLFGLICILSVLLFRDKETMLFNTIGTLLYVSLIWLGLKLYLYLKFKQNKNIINELLGMADVLVIISIGITFNVVGLIFFFCFGFIFSLLVYAFLQFFKKQKRLEGIPLAGLLVVFYALSIFILSLVKANTIIDCSFVN